jgi:hypothetical protein
LPLPQVVHIEDVKDLMKHAGGHLISRNYIAPSIVIS